MTTEGGLCCRQVEPRPAPQWVGWALAGALLLLVASLAWQWLCVSTHRLYLDESREPEATAPMGARQRFDLTDGRVTPQIVSTENERLSFSVGLPRPSKLHLRVVPGSEATIEIAIIEGGARRLLLRRRVLGDTALAQAVPATTDLIELANEGDLVWSDPRVVQGTDTTAAFLGLLAVLALAAIVGLRPGGMLPMRLPRVAWARTALLGALTAAVTVGVCLTLLEVSLRAIGARLPSWITDYRQGLGEAQTDPRWQDSASYGPRLAPLVDTFCEWQHGDIVRMGFLPPDLVPHPTYRFPFVTDANGFRNSKSDPSDSVVAALGDSFTDGMTLPVQLTWPARLEQLLGVSVRNYGTAGFGPGQELRVLREYALAGRPRWVVVAFFAGNDLVDAERFERFESGGHLLSSVGRGWKIKNVIARFDRLYSLSLYQGASGQLKNRASHLSEEAPSPTAGDYSGEDPTASSGARLGFDRGLFTVPVGGRVLRFAFLPPYLNRLTLSREQIEASRGWKLTRESYQEMQRLARDGGGELIVLFIPSKSQVYLPLLEASFGAAELGEALRVSLAAEEPPELPFIMRNRLALNDLMREFCAVEGIEFLDLTAELESKVGGGQNVYFPDDSHWNAVGHETAAAAIARLLRAENL